MRPPAPRSPRHAAWQILAIGTCYCRGLRLTLNAHPSVSFCINTGMTRHWFFSFCQLRTPGMGDFTNFGIGENTNDW